MIDTTIKFLKNIKKNNRLFLIIISILLFRLLFNIDNYLTIRDFDFYPDYINKLSLSFLNYYLFRPFIAFINYLALKLTHLDILTFKQILNKTYILIYIPVFLQLCTHLKLTIREKKTAILLLLSNSIIFSIYDTLSPYFLMLILSNLYIVYLFKIRKNTGLTTFTIITIIMLLTHWLAGIFFIFSLNLILKNNKIIKRNKYIIIGLPLIIFTCIGINVFNYITVKELPSKLSEYMTIWFPVYKTNLEFILKTIYSSVLVLPKISGIYFNNKYFVFFASLIILIAIFRTLNNLLKTNYLKKYFKIIIVSSILLPVLIQITDKILRNSFHYNTLLYSTFSLPIILIILAIYLNQIKNKYLFNILLFLIILPNLFIGYNYREEGFNLKEYIKTEKSLSKNIPNYLTPSFINKVMYQRYTEDYSQNKSIFKIDNFKQITDQQYYLVIAEYKELGEYFYNYPEYEKN